MRSNYGRRRPRLKGRENGSHWLTFSDLMSALLLIFILVMFYSVYQYFDMLEITTAELTRQQDLLNTQKTAIDEKDKDLQASQEKLTESERALLSEQAKLVLSQRKIDDAQAALAQQQQELEAANAQLAEKQIEVDEKQTLLTQQQQKMTDQQQLLDDLVGVRTQIIEELASKLRDAGIDAKVDEQGSITLNSDVFFDTASSELKDDGKGVLDEFFPVYLSVLLDDEYKKNISEIIIEGHTDTDGGYESNLYLSQARASSVWMYLLSDEYTGISAATKESLKRIVTVSGRSFVNPKYGEDGSMDKTASRRVEIKFRLQDEQMIDSMRQILETMREDGAGD